MPIQFILLYAMRMVDYVGVVFSDFTDAEIIYQMVMEWLAMGGSMTDAEKEALERLGKILSEGIASDRW